MTTITQLITRTLELDKAATPGPWCRDRSNNFISATESMVCDYVLEDEDSNIIAEYRTAAPELARECQRLQKELDKVKYELLKTDPGI